MEQTIRSVLDQGYPNLEYIIIDGGSTDQSPSIIKKYENQLHYWCSEPDDGHYHAVNKGFSHATGEIMAWLNSDDMYCPWALRTVGSVFREFPSVTWLGTLNPLTWSKDGYCINVKRVAGYSAKAFADGEYATFSKRRTGFIQQESTFWRRTLWEKVGKLETEFELAADMRLWARFFEHAQLHGVVSPLAGFRMHDSNKSLNKDAYLVEARRIVQEFSATNPKFASPTRKFLNRLIRKIPIIRHHLSFYSVQNVFRTLPVEGDNWKIVRSRF